MAVRYLQRAAECAVYDLQTGIAQSTLVAKQELVLAIYELGVCFQHGWGVSDSGCFFLFADRSFD